MAASRSLAGRGPIPETVHLVDQDDDPGAGRDALPSPLGMGQDPGHDRGRDGGPHRGTAERADELRTVDVIGVQGCAEDVGADHGNDQRRLRRDDRFVVGGSLEWAHARAVGLVQEAHVREPVAQAPEEIEGDALGLAAAGLGRADDEHVPVARQRGRDALPRRVGGGDVGGRQRDLCAEDARGRGGDRAPPAVHHLARQAKHGRGLPASSDQRDDLVSRHPKRVRQRHRRTRKRSRTLRRMRETLLS